MGRGTSKAGVGGSRMYQTDDLDHSSKLQSALNKEEKRTLNLKKEQMTVYDRDDEPVIHRGGTSGSVGYSIAEAQTYFYGATITHNHPHGDERGGVSATFSAADVDVFRYGAKEMRASGAEGTYVLRNRNFNNSSANKAVDFYNAYSVVCNQYQSTSLKELKSAQEKASKSKIGRQYTSELKKANKLYGAGDRRAAMQLYEHAEKTLEPAYKREVKRVVYETMNSHLSGWLKQNAPKYGFDYVLTSTGGKK